VGPSARRIEDNWPNEAPVGAVMRASSLSSPRDHIGGDFSFEHITLLISVVSTRLPQWSVQLIDPSLHLARVLSVQASARPKAYTLPAELHSMNLEP